MSSNPGRGVIPRITTVPVIPAGTVVRAPIVPVRGIVKIRPSIVIREHSGSSNEPLFVIGVTSDNGQYDPAKSATYPPKDFFPIPFSRDGSHPAGFNRPSAAKRDWVQAFQLSEIEFPGRRLSGRALEDLIGWLGS